MYEKIKNCCVQDSRSLLDAMRTIDAGAVGIALVVDDSGRLLGTLTDGDIRRALLKSAALSSPLLPHIHRNFTAVAPETGRVEVLDLMQARYLNQVPIVDAEGKLRGLHLLHEIIGAVERPNWAVIMAGGKGTRLRPITENLPKPMIRVAGRPILERLILHLVGFGIRRIYLSINYLGHIIEEHFGDGSRFGCQIEYLREEAPLGTGGALSLLPKPPTAPLLVLNGDLVTQADLGAMLEFHSRNTYVATMAVRRYFHQVPFGCVELDSGRIKHLEEKPLLEKFINAGIYVLSPEVLARIPKGFFPITNLFEECIERKLAIGGFEVDDDWIDVGQREQLKQAQEGGGNG